jgi:hypothetical protein
LRSGNGHFKFIVPLDHALLLADLKIQQINLATRDDIGCLSIVVLSQDVSNIGYVRTIGCDFGVLGGVEHGDPVGVHDHDGVGVMVLY